MRTFKRGRGGILALTHTLLHTEVERLLSMKFTFIQIPMSEQRDHLIGLVVKASASEAEDPEFNSGLHQRDFSGSSHTSDLKIGTPVATLPGAWPHRVSPRTGWLGVSIL